MSRGLPRCKKCTGARPMDLSENPRSCSRKGEHTSDLSPTSVSQSTPVIGNPSVRTEADSTTTSDRARVPQFISAEAKQGKPETYLCSCCVSCERGTSAAGSGPHGFRWIPFVASNCVVYARPFCGKQLCCVRSSSVISAKKQKTASKASTWR